MANASVSRAGDDEVDRLRPTERAECERADGMAQRIVVGPGRALDEERNDEQRSGDHSTDEHRSHARPFWVAPPARQRLDAARAGEPLRMPRNGVTCWSFAGRRVPLRSPNPSRRGRASRRTSPGTSLTAMPGRTSPRAAARREATLAPGWHAEPPLGR